MALDKQVFKTRTLTALVFGAIMLLALLGPLPIFYVVFAMATYIGCKEFLQIIERIENKLFNPVIVLLFPLAGLSIYFIVGLQNTHSTLIDINNSSIGIVIAEFLLFGFLTLHNKKLSMLPLGFLYIPVSFGILAQLYDSNSYIPLALIVLIWINDTMQYIMGSLFGKHKMAPIISPKKTWEGTIYGSLCSIVVAIILQQFFGVYNIYMALCATAIGTLGDLLESYLKRKAGIKDSGTLMPGHGGILDRFDSLLLASIAYGLIFLLLY